MASVTYAPRLVEGLKNTLRDAGKAVVAINGLEQMEARFVRAVKEASGAAPASATADVEEIRRVKTQEELEWITKAAQLADRGYEQFVSVARAGMTEFELVAEVEGFVKAHGAEDNFMLVASGGIGSDRHEAADRPQAAGGRLGDHGAHPANQRLLRADLSHADHRAALARSNSSRTPSSRRRSKPRRTCCARGSTSADVARVQNDVFRKHGYGDYTGAQYTRVRGHNLGLYPDELPHVLENMHYTCKKDMVDHLRTPTRTCRFRDTWCSATPCW